MNDINRRRKTEWQRNWYRSLSPADKASYLRHQRRLRKPLTPERRAKLNAYKRRLYKKLYKRNSGKVLAKNALRRAARQRAIPVWASKKALTEFYENCPSDHHVDHIFPLRSDWVCGLHVLNNLQYLPSTENLRKGNAYQSEFHYKQGQFVSLPEELRTIHG